MIDLWLIHLVLLKLCFLSLIIPVSSSPTLGNHHSTLCFYEWQVQSTCSSVFGLFHLVKCPLGCFIQVIDLRLFFLFNILLTWSLIWYGIFTLIQFKMPYNFSLHSFLTYGSSRNVKNNHILNVQIFGSFFSYLLMIDF